MFNFDRNKLRSRIIHTDIFDSVIGSPHKVKLRLLRNKIISAEGRGLSETLRLAKTRNFEMNSLGRDDG